MIVSMGIDLTPHAEMATAVRDQGEAFVRVVLTEREAASLSKSRRRDAQLSAFFSIKEAAMKALGRGLLDGLWFTDVEVLENPRRLEWRRAALKRYRELGEPKVHVALGQDRSRSFAMVVLERVA